MTSGGRIFSNTAVPQIAIVVVANFSCVKSASLFCTTHERVRHAFVLLWAQVNLAHQGMGDVMGGILADCLVGLPLMRELNLRDNRLTDKGLIPIVKVNIPRMEPGIAVAASPVFQH